MTRIIFNKFISSFLRGFCILAIFIVAACEDEEVAAYLSENKVLLNGEEVTIEDVQQFKQQLEADSPSLVAKISSDYATNPTTTKSAVLKEEVTSSSSSSASEASVEALPDGSTTPLVTDECPELLDSTPRGLACLHCMQPEARAQAEALAMVLHRSCLKNIAINYLADGSFSFDASLLYNHINLLTQNGRQLFLYFYLTNGPSQRRYRSTPIEALGTKISPDEFRKRVLGDAATQVAFQANVKRLIPFIRYANSRGAQVSLVMGLEDNLSRQAFNKLYSLANEALPSDLQVSLGRNACEGCYSGNDGYVPKGAFTEKHLATSSFWDRDGMITNDGQDYSSPNSPGNKFLNLTLDDLRGVQERAGALNNAFILWSAERQGLPENSKSLNIAPKDRVYVVPSYKERLELIEFLKEGLVSSSQATSNLMNN